MDVLFALKKTLTLLALVDPLLAVPIFLSATARMDFDAKRRFSKQLAMTVVIALLFGGLIGLHLLSLLGVSLAAIQVGGGAIVFQMALAMVVAKEEQLKMNAAEAQQASAGPSIVPLGVPLLAGPAALSYVMATSEINAAGDLLHILIPPLVVGMATLICFFVASRGGKFFSQSTLSLVERLSGFLLAAIAIEMMVAGLKSLFPVLSGQG